MIFVSDHSFYGHGNNCYNGNDNYNGNNDYNGNNGYNGKNDYNGNNCYNGNNVQSIQPSKNKLAATMVAINCTVVITS